MTQDMQDARQEDIANWTKERDEVISAAGDDLTIPAFLDRTEEGMPEDAEIIQVTEDVGTKDESLPF